MSAPRARLPTFFFAGEYPVDGQSDTVLFVSVSPPSQKRFTTPARWCDAGDVGDWRRRGEECERHFFVSDGSGGSVGRGR